MKKIIVFLACFMLLFTSTVFADNIRDPQNPGVDLTITDLHFTDTVYVNKPATLSVDITNIGNETYNGSGQILVDWGDGYGVVILLSDPIDPSGTYNLQDDYTYTNRTTYTLSANVSAPDDEDPSNDYAELEVVVNNNPPEITPIADQFGVLGQEFTYQVEATDFDNDPLTYGVSGDATGMTIDDSGLITWTPTGAGTFAVTVSVSDGFDTVQEPFDITISQAGASMEVTDLELGGSDQERDETISGTFTITNIGNETLTGISFTDTVSDDYELVLTPLTTTLPPGQSTDVSVSAFVPDYQDAGRENIGKVTVHANYDGLSINKDNTVYLEAINHLVINDLDVEVDGDGNDIDDGEVIDDVKPGDEVEIVVELKNTFDENIDIEDIDIEITSDNDLDFDDSDSIDKIKDGDEEKVTFLFTVPSDVEDDEQYEIEIDVQGDDENNAKHGEIWTFELEVNKPRDEITVDSWDFSQDPVCNNADFVTLRVDILNTGRDDQEHAQIQVESEDLDYNSIEREINIDEGDDWTESFRIPLPGDLLVGNTYSFTITTFHGRGSNTDSDIETAFLEVRDCGPVEEEEEEDEGIDVTPPITGNVVFGEPVSKKDDNGLVYIIALIGLAIIIIVVIILLLIKILSKPK
jgi:uncharacterized repeat protein (TIGR01451 family)